MSVTNLFIKFVFWPQKFKKIPKNGQFQPFLSFIRHISRIIGGECQNIIILNEYKLVSPYFTVEHPKHDEGNLSKTSYSQKMLFFTVLAWQVSMTEGCTRYQTIVISQANLNQVSKPKKKI